MDGGSYVGGREEGAGGVGRNLADALGRLGTPALLISALGDDPEAARLRNFCSHMVTPTLPFPAFVDVSGSLSGR